MLLTVGRNQLENQEEVDNIYFGACLNRHPKEVKFR